MDDQEGRSTPPYLRNTRGVQYSPFRGSMRSEANSSISSYHDFPHAKKYQADGLASPKGIVPQANSRAVISALKGLQEKIRKLELERTDAEDNLKRLATESKHYKDILQKEHHAKSASRGMISKQNEDLQDDLQGAESRCNLLEKQLDYMRKMVQTAEMDRDNAVQRSAMLTQQISHQATQDIKGQLGKLTGLEREHMKLTASQSLAENKIRELEDRLRGEAHHRKLLQDKTAQLQTESERNRILLEVASPPKIKKNKKKKLKAKPRTQPLPANPPGHFHLNLGNIPFVAGKSATRSHSVGANIQQALSLLKGHNPSLCNALSQRQARRYSSSTSSDTEGLEDLLLGLQDEFGHMSFEHQELGRQINDTEEPMLREDLERELEHLVKRMEAKGEQIAMVKRQLSKRTGQRPKQKYRTQPTVHSTRPRSASARLPASGGEVEVITTVKTKGTKSVFTEVENRIHKRSGFNAEKNLKVLKGMQNLQSSLTKDDLHWD